MKPQSALIRVLRNSSGILPMLCISNRQDLLRNFFENVVDKVESVLYNRQCV